MNAVLQSAGPNLLVLTTEGELIVAPRSPEKFEEQLAPPLQSPPTADLERTPVVRRVPRHRPRRQLGRGVVDN